MAAFLASLRDVAVGLSPIVAASPFSQGKSFGKILGYLDAGVPVIASDEADHALFFTAESGVVSNDPAVWEAAVARLLDDGAARAAMAGAARADMQRRLSVAAAAARLDGVLRGLLAGGDRTVPSLTSRRAKRISDWNSRRLICSSRPKSTPNPATLKFLPGQTVLEMGTADFPGLKSAQKSPLAGGSLRAVR